MRISRRAWWLLLLIPVVGFLWFAQPWVFIPHQHIVIALPYSLSDTPSGMIPMGETIYHPKPKVPHGHPGVDFNWDGEELHPILASADGVVTHIAEIPGKTKTYDVELRHGYYVTRYKEMSSLASGVVHGAHIKRGQPVGEAGHNCDDLNGPHHCWANIHWELASTSLLRDRFCPVTYFNVTSRQAIEKLWANVPANDRIKSKFPEICDGDYRGKVE